MIPLSLSQLLHLVLQSVHQPKMVIQQVLTFTLTRKQLMLLSLLLVVVGLIAGLLLEIISPQPPEGAMNLSQGVGPFFLLQFAGILIGAGLVYAGGQLFKGKGSFDDCLKMVLWLSFVNFVLQFSIPLATLFSVSLAVMAFVAVILISLVQIIAYVMVVHGFTRIIPVAFGVFGGLIIAGILFKTLIAMLGIDIGMEPV